MSSDLVERLLAAIGETERISRLACGCEQSYEGDGERWRWEYAGLYDDRVDQPVEFDPADMYIAQGGHVSLRSVEQYPTRSVGPLPNFVISGTDELRGAVAAHMTHHDPHAVLRRCAADRKIVGLHQREPAGKGYVDCSACHSPYEHESEEWPCDTLKALAEGYGVSVEEP